MLEASGAIFRACTERHARKTTLRSPGSFSQGLIVVIMGVQFGIALSNRWTLSFLVTPLLFGILRSLMHGHNGFC